MPEKGDAASENVDPSRNAPGGQVDDEGGGPVVFNREYASKRPASDHPGPEMAGGKQRSITRAITSKEYRGGEGADEESPKGTVSRWAAETAGVGRWARG